MCRKLRKILVILVEFAFIYFPGTSGNGGNFYEDRICATFYSELNFGGNNFVLSDGDQSVNMRKDFRSSIDGWGNTTSIRVEENCTLSACSGTYFEGSCKSYPAGEKTDIIQLRIIQSASCTCSKECRCEDIVILRNEEVCGRAYVNETCNDCDSHYFDLKYLGNSLNFLDFPWDYADSVRVIAIRSGCHLTLYTYVLGEGFSSVITGPMVQDLHGTLGSYMCTCDNDAYSPPFRTISGPIPINLPNASDQLLEMIFLNATLAAHPGLLATKASLQSGRSHQNAYVLIIGTNAPEYIGLFGKCGSCESQICECQVVLDLGEVGILHSQIRVVWAYFDADEGSDAQWVASLDQYLSTHEDLKDCIPNTVILFHEYLKGFTITDQGSKFQKALAAVNMLRGSVLDENYSNLVFADSESVRNPEARILAFEAAINDNWNFPRPTVVLPVDGGYNYQPKVNGHWRLTSGEYYFDNVYRAMLLVSKKGGDALGHAVFKAAFPVADKEWTFLKVTKMDLLPLDHAHVTFHQQLALDSARLQAFSIQGAMNRTQKLSTIAEKISKEEQIVNFACKMRAFGESNTDTSSHFLNIGVQAFATTNANENLHWTSVSTLSLAAKKSMYNCGFVNGRGIRLYVCRGFVNGVVRVGSFNFEDGACQIWYKKLVSLRKNAEVLMIPGGITKITEAERNGTEYRLQYEIVSSHQIPRNGTSEHVVPVFAGNSNPRNTNKYIAFATFAEEAEFGLAPVDKIGTASLYPPKQKLARFAGVGRPLDSENFKVLVLTKTIIQTLSNN